MHDELQFNQRLAMSARNQKAARQNLRCLE